MSKSKKAEASLNEPLKPVKYSGNLNSSEKLARARMRFLISLGLLDNLLQQPVSNKTSMASIQDRIQAVKETGNMYSMLPSAREAAVFKFEDISKRDATFYLKFLEENLTKEGYEASYHPEDLIRVVRKLIRKLTVKIERLKPAAVARQSASDKLRKFACYYLLTHSLVKCIKTYNHEQHIVSSKDGVNYVIHNLALQIRSAPNIAENPPDLVNVMSLQSISDEEVDAYCSWLWKKGFTNSVALTPAELTMLLEATNQALAEKTRKLLLENLSHNSQAKQRGMK